LENADHFFTNVDRALQFEMPAIRYWSVPLVLSSFQLKQWF